MNKTHFILALLLLATFNVAAAESPAKENQIAGALAALPDAEYSDSATVMGWDGDKVGVTLRKGEGPWICIADNDADERFHTACYHRSLDPFMARGRELKAEGVGGKERHQIRHEEVDAGKLAMPSGPTTLASVSGQSFDPETGMVQGERRIYVVYTPYATPESTGLPTKPNKDQPSAPWIMRQGTPSAHIMITPGPVQKEKEPAGE